MTVDWLTVGAQVLNFLVLVYLLKGFLYARVVRAMDRREATIAERMRAADARMEEAEQEGARHREAREALEAQRERLVTRAREEADDLRRELEQEIRRQTEEARSRWREQLEREQAAVLRDVRRRTTEHFETLARRALADLADTELEAQMARVLVARLEELDRDRRDELAAAMASGEPLVVRSAFELPHPVKRSLTATIHEALGKDIAVRYELADDLACGIELRGGGQSLAWSLDGYLDVMQRGLAEGLRQVAAGGTREPAR